MEYIDTFSERLAQREREGKPVIYQYDELPGPFRVKAQYILEDALGSKANIVWEHMRTTFKKSNGILKIQDYAPARFDCREVILKWSVPHALDMIEIGFIVVASLRRKTLDKYQKEKYGISMKADAAIERLNATFQRYDLGYQFTGGKIIPVDSMVMHREVVEPAIELLYEHGFEGPLDEFMRAHAHLRAGEYQDALVDANNALESTIKTILGKQGVPLSGIEKADALIDAAFKTFIPSHMRTHFNGLRAAMKGLPVHRNRTDGAGHGQGETPKDIAQHAATYAIHLAAADIVFLIEAWKDLERREPRIGK